MFVIPKCKTLKVFTKFHLHVRVSDTLSVEAKDFGYDVVGLHQQYDYWRPSQHEVAVYTTGT
jgi:hypothetical protein